MVITTKPAPHQAPADIDAGELWTIEEARAGHDFDPATGHFPEMDDEAEE